MSRLSLLALVVGGCTLAPTPAGVSQSPTPEPTPTPIEIAEALPSSCGAFDLEAWRVELEAAAPEARAELLARLGLTLDDDGDGETDPHAALHLRSVQVRAIELGGPRGLEQVVEVVVVDNQALELTHVHAAVQVFTPIPGAGLCRTLDRGRFATTWLGTVRPAVLLSGPRLGWYPQAIDFVELLAPGVHAIELRRATGEITTARETSEYSLSYLSLDERGQLTEIFGPYPLFHQRIERDSAIPIMDVHGSVEVQAGEWPARIETTEQTISVHVGESSSRRGQGRTSWVLRDGVYQSWQRSFIDLSKGPDCNVRTSP